MEKNFKVFSGLLDMLAQTNQAWHIRESEVFEGHPSKVLSKEAIKKKDERAKNMND